MAIPSVDRVRVKVPLLSYCAMQKLKMLEVSALGLHQLAVGSPVTTPRDRNLLATFLAASTPPRGHLVLSRAGWETLLRSDWPDDRVRIAETLESVITKTRKAA
jgi:hypothetical protein